MKRRIGLAALVLAADLGGTFVFALEGASVAIHAGLDLLGIAVIGFVSGLGGGIVRDVLLGAVPPAAIKDRRYPFTAMAGAAIAILAAQVFRTMPHTPLLVLDAAGFALFAVTGLQKALVRGVGAFGAVLMGMLTAVAGGVVRDVLLAQAPAILRSGFYASAAILGCVAILLARRFGLSMQAASGIGGLVCFIARLLAASGDWRLPVYH